MTLRELLIEKGRTSVWVLRELKKKQVRYSEPHFSRIANGEFTPVAEKFYKEVAELLMVEPVDIKMCFAKHRKQIKKSK